MALILANLANFGCSHYYLPNNHLETPETCGESRLGRVAIILNQSGANLTDPPNQAPADPETNVTPDPQLQNSILHFALGSEIRITDQLDIGLRIQPQAPLTFRGKYQFYGKPEGRSEFGDWSSAISLGLGFLFGDDSGSSSTYFLEDLNLMLGYRLGRQHLLALGGFVTLSQLSGVSSKSSGKASSSASVSGATGFGTGLTYQWNKEDLFLRAELSTFLGGSSGSNKLSGFGLGALLGLNL